MEFAILGPLEVSAGGRLLPLPGARLRAVLAMLLVRAGQVVAAERLTEELWPGRPADRAAASLQVRVSQLRKTLRLAGEPDRLVTQSPGYLLRVEPGELDAARFGQLAGAGRGALAAGDAELAAQRLDQALSLWRGPVLADLADLPFARAEAARLDEERAAALETRAEARLACGKHAELVAELEMLTAAYPLRERLWAQRMLALYRAGRQADALRAYRDLRAILVSELGIEPGPELRELEGRILRHDAGIAPGAPGLDAASMDGTGDPVRAQRRRGAPRLPGAWHGRPGHHRRARPDQPPGPVVGGPGHSTVLPAAGAAGPPDHVRQAGHRAVRSRCR